MASKTRSGFYASSLVFAWLVASLVVSFILIAAVSLISVAMDPAKLMLVWGMIWLPITLFYSAPFMAVFGTLGGIWLARRPSAGPATTFRAALMVGVFPAVALGIAGLALSLDWNILSIGAVAAPVYALVTGWAINRRRNAGPES